jgi:RNA polymerase sigma factor (sigma-70 family)
MEQKSKDAESEERSPVRDALLKYECAIKRVIARITRSRDLAEDLAQDVFLRVLAAEKKTLIENAKAYVFEAARNAARTERSKRSRRILEAVDDAIREQRIDAELSAEAVTIGRERLTLFCEAVTRLPPQCKTVFIMCKVQGRSYRDISRSLGISESTVEKHIGTALARCTAYIRLHELGEVAGTLQVLEQRRRS